MLLRDRAAINSVAFSGLSVLYYVAEDLKCLSHTLCLVGEKFYGRTLSSFWSAWVQIYAVSKRARRIFSEKVGVAWKTYSATRWWSQYECMDLLMVNFQEIRGVLVALQNERLSGSSGCVTTCTNILDNPRYVKELKVQLAAVIDAGKPFVEATHFLEGDGLLAFHTHEKVVICSRFAKDPHLPNLVSICRDLAGPDADEYQRLYNLGRVTVDNGLNYWTMVTEGELSPVIQIFKVAEFLRPSRFFLLNPSVDSLDDWNSLKIIKTNQISLQHLKDELPAYFAAAADIPDDSNLKLFWSLQQNQLPAFTSLFKHFCLLLPSSGAVERVFSLLKHFLDDSTDKALQDYIFLALLLKFNAD
jgi:hypothetical protein